MRKGGSHCVCLSVIIIDSVFKMGKNYYQNYLYKEYKHVVNRMK